MKILTHLWRRFFPPKITTAPAVPIEEFLAANAKLHNGAGGCIVVEKSAGHFACMKHKKEWTDPKRACSPWARELSRDVKANRPLH